MKSFDGLIINVTAENLRLGFDQEANTPMLLVDSLKLPSTALIYVTDSQIEELRQSIDTYLAARKEKNELFERKSTLQ